MYDKISTLILILTSIIGYIDIYKKLTKDMISSNSMKANLWDNACIESFHSHIKRKWLNRYKITDYAHAYRQVFEYLERFYNTVRIHAHCEYQSLNQYKKKL